MTPWLTSFSLQIKGPCRGLGVCRNSIVHRTPPFLLSRDPGVLTLHPPETQKSRIPAERIPSMSHPHETPKNRHTTGFLLLYLLLQKTPQAKPLLILRASWFLTPMETNLSRQVETSAKLRRLLDLLCFCQGQHQDSSCFLEFLPSRACQHAGAPHTHTEGSQ